MTAEADVALLQQRSNILNPNSVLKTVVDEMLAVVPMVEGWVGVDGGGHAETIYNVHDDSIRGFEVHYQFGNMGNLLHELTHCRVAIAHEQDCVNYRNAGAAGNVPAPQYSHHGRRTNEALRQAAWRDQGQEDTLENNLFGMHALVAGLGLSVQQGIEVGNKLVYGIQSIYIEYDTVINQILMWMYEWGYPTTVPMGQPVPPINAFVTQLEQHVQNAHNRRANNAQVA